jgi:glutamate dehydrogenase (NAD(P)+)
MATLGLKPGIAGKTVVIQGLGNVGFHAAKFLQEAGAVLVGLAEYEGAIYNPKGLDLASVVAHRKETGSILNYPGSQNLEHTRAALELECDILVPAALEGQLTKDNAGQVKAKIIAEAANGPVTADADAILLEKNVMILPDAFLNAGGVTVSYFEWLRNLSHVRFGRMSKRFGQSTQQDTLDAIETMTGKTFPMDVRDRLIRGADEVALVYSGLEETMISAYEEIRTIAKNHNVDLRTAAFIDAIDKVAVAYKEMGIFP